MAEAALAVAAVLALAVLLDRRGVALPVLLLIVGVGFAPLPLAIAHAIGVFGIGLDLGAVIVGSPSALACGLTANGLVGPELGGLEGLLAVTAGAKHQINTPGIVLTAIPRADQICQI